MNEAYLPYAAMTKDVAQRRSWTFYEAINQVPPSTGKLMEFVRLKKWVFSSRIL